MNSRQRRFDRRCWKHSVKILVRDWHVYNDMWQWLANRHGKKIYKCGWREKCYYADDITERMNVTWEFRKEKDLMEFILRWS